MDKYRCYDPRKKEIVLTDNPALIMGRLIASSRQNETLDMKVLASLANYCDEIVDSDTAKKKKRYMQSTCSCRIIHVSPLVRAFLIGERICTVHCSCGKDFDVYYNLTLQDGQNNPTPEGMSGRLEQNKNGEYVVVPSDKEGKED